MSAEEVLANSSTARAIHSTSALALLVSGFTRIDSPLDVNLQAQIIR